MKKMLYLFLTVIAVVLAAKVAYACFSKDAEFRLGIINELLPCLYITCLYIIKYIKDGH
jgi:hypothetical protein